MSGRMLDLLGEARAALAVAFEAASGKPVVRAAVADAIAAVAAAQAVEIARARARGRGRGRLSCPECGQRFRWNGELSAHRWRVHEVSS